MEMRSAAKHSAAQSSSEQLTAVHKREREGERGRGRGGERRFYSCTGEIHSKHNQRAYRQIGGPQSNYTSCWHMQKYAHF